MCITPFTVKKKMTNESIPVPCGKCPECVARRQSGWSFRLMQEDKVSTSSYFITLTYDTRTVPITRNGFMSLNKRDVQLFYKRLRKAHVGRGDDNNAKPIKYYTVGEYGETSNRPHYHAILFNADVSLIQDAWQNGHVQYGTVTGASVGYCLKYMSKRRKIPMHKNDDRVPEFGLMSKGLGLSYMTDKMMRWHLANLDSRVYCNLEDGKKIAMPRYYKDKLFSELYFESAELAEHIRKRVCMYQLQEIVKRQIDEQLKEGDDYWRRKAEDDKAAFKRMDYNLKKGQKL